MVLEKLVVVLVAVATLVKQVVLKTTFLIHLEARGLHHLPKRKDEENQSQRKVKAKERNEEEDLNVLHKQNQQKHQENQVHSRDFNMMELSRYNKFVHEYNKKYDLDVIWKVENSLTCDHKEQYLYKIGVTL